MGCSTARNPASGHKDQMKYLRSCFERENKRWEQILVAPQKLEEQLSKRLDSDKIVFYSPRLTPLPVGRAAEGADGGGNPPATAPSEHPQPRSVHRCEAEMFRAQAQRELLSRGSLGGACQRPPASPKKLAAAVDRRSLREMRHLLFGIRAKYRATHKRYARMQGFSSCANRIAVAHRQQKRTLNSFSARDSPSDLPTWTVVAPEVCGWFRCHCHQFQVLRRRSPTRSGGYSISSSANSNLSAPMKASDLLIYILGVAGALAGYFLLRSPFSWAAIGICAAFALWTLLVADADGRGVLRLAGLSWSMEDFVRGWLITGRTGSGKTQCAINTITCQIFQNVPHWVGVCLDQKGTLLGNPCEDGRTLRAGRRPRLAANPVSRKR